MLEMEKKDFFVERTGRKEKPFIKYFYTASLQIMLKASAQRTPPGLNAIFWFQETLRFIGSAAGSPKLPSHISLVFVPRSMAISFKIAQPCPFDVWRSSFPSGNGVFLFKVGYLSI